MNLKTLSIIALFALVMVVAVYIVIQSPGTPQMNPSGENTMPSPESPSADQQEDKGSLPEGPQPGDRVVDLDELGEMVWGQIKDEQDVIDTEAEWLERIVSALQEIQAEGDLPEDADLRQLSEVIFTWFEDRGKLDETS